MLELFKPPCMPRIEVWKWLVSIKAEAGKRSTAQYYRYWLDFTGFNPNLHYLPQDTKEDIRDAIITWLFELDEDDHKRIMKKELWTNNT